MGGLFVAVKIVEYAHHFGQGINLSTNTFYMFYISLTFFHFMHVIMGMVILGAVAMKAHRGGTVPLSIPVSKPGPPTGTWWIWCG